MRLVQERKQTYAVKDVKALAHRAKHTLNAEVKHGIKRIDWPASSPDLNPIETIWRVMKDKLDSLPVRPSTIPEMIQLLETMWNNLDPHVDILSHITSLPTRIKAVIEANGGHTKFQLIFFSFYDLLSTTSHYFY